jgi:hypothetical protein
MNSRNLSGPAGNKAAAESLRPGRRQHDLEPATTASTASQSSSTTSLADAVSQAASSVM